jgi:cyclomaltodextrinase / maltogenic alpha-amylase / neopullulanase
MRRILTLILALLTVPLVAQKLHTISGKVVRLENFQSQYVKSRNIDVWLPDGYDTSTRYAVMYMNDGQMLFDSSLTWNHQAWNIDKTLSGLMKDGSIRKCIVVGIWNIPAIRHAEFFPQKAFALLSANEKQMVLQVTRNDNSRVFEESPVSDLYLRFIVNELKPYIDSAFSTLRERQNTFIAGSSMGGLISLYAICEYPGIFGGAACLSTHWTGIYRTENNPIPGALIRYMDHHLPDPNTHKIYFDYGTATLDSLYEPFQQKVDQLMVKKGYTRENWITMKFPGEDHSENAWSKRFGIPAEFLLGIPYPRTSVQDSDNPFDQPPDWAKSAIWYQIFVERFNNGDQSNDPKPKNINIPPVNRIAPEGWSATPWTKDWYDPEDWAEKTGKSFGDMVQYRRYGGDLQGVLDKLDYLQELGVTALFINPLNDAPSLHKYDARNYHHVDVNFGPDPEGDNRIIASENPNDPSTWKWTSADKLFLELVKQVHARNMKIIMDYSWNHTGVMFWAWQDILKNQEKSKYRDWYEITSFNNPSTPQNEFAYKGWAGVSDLPELKKVNITTTRVSGYPYEGDINEGAKKHIFAVTTRWLAPNGDPSKGIDGFRLDVADQIGMVFWRDFRKVVRSIKPDAYLVGEIWWAQWPDKLMDPVPYTGGDVFDAVMFYQTYKPARYFFAKTEISFTAQQLKDSLEFQWNRLRPSNRYAMMNVSSSHDAPRLLTDFYNPNKYKYKATPNDDPNYKTGKPDAETYQRLKLYLVHLFTTIGAPQIWNGEEMGMWGADDPHCRKPLWWKDYAFEPETRTNFQPGEKTYDLVGFNQRQFDWYQKLIRIRKENPALVDGEIAFLESDGKKLAYKRSDQQQEIFILFNLEPTKQDFSLPERAVYLDLLTNKKTRGNHVELDPLTVVILIKSK